MSKAGRRDRENGSQCTLPGVDRDSSVDGRCTDGSTEEVDLAVREEEFLVDEHPVDASVSRGRPRHVARGFFVEVWGRVGVRAEELVVQFPEDKEQEDGW